MTNPGRPDDAASDRDALLELLLADEGIEQTRSGISPRDASQPAVLSYAQERMWFLDQFETDTAALAVRVAVALHGPLDVAALRRGLDEIFRRHDVLRTVVVATSGEARPVVLALDSMPVRELDVDGDDEALAAVLAEEAARTFDLEREPPIVVALVRVADEHHVLSVVMHHIASDGSSFGVFFQELAVLYEAFRQGRPSPLPELAVQYEDYAAWQRHTASEIFERQLDHWRRQLASPLPSFEIPPDFSRPARHGFSGSTISAQLSPGLTARVAELCRSTGATTFMVLLAAFEVVVSRHAGDGDVAIGTPIAGRVRSELEPMIGVFLNTLVLRDDLTDDPTFRDLLARVRDTSLGAFGNQDVPFELVLADLQPPRDLSRTPLFQIFFNMTHHDSDRAVFMLPGLRLEILEQPDPGSKFDLTMYVNEASSTTDVRLVYNRALFEHAHMERLVDQYLHLLEQVVADPDRRIGELVLRTEGERAAVPDASEALDATWHGSVPDLVRGVATRAPHRLAVTDGSNEWTFGLLATQMDALAGWLTARRVGHGDVVAVYAHRSGSLVRAVTGVLASGAAYVLLDPQYPPARLAQLLRIVEPSAWLALDAAGPPPGAVVSVLDELCVEHRVSLPRRADAAELWACLGVAGDESGVPCVDIGPDDPACLTFTSGSTGTPKAVIGRHGSLTHFLPWMSDEFGVGEDDRFSMLSGLSHDPLQRDMFWPLSLGAAIVVPDPEQMGTAGYLARWMSDERVSVAHFTPAMGQLVTEPSAAVSDRRTSVASLRVALFIGDVLTQDLVARLQRMAPNVRVVNLYGTTETQRASGYHVVGVNERPAGGTRPKEVLPLGRGMPGAQLLVRTSGRTPAAIGEVGEVVMRSPHLALGYWHDDELTAARFEPDPHGASAHDQLYATGDRGRYRADGAVEFLGRSDQQVKLRGFRIELGEVSAALRKEAGIADAVVDLHTGDPTSPTLVAYVVPVAGARIDPGELVRSLRLSLPAHMVPSDVVEMDRLPLTPNGKLDRRALPGPSRGEGSIGGAFAAPRDQLERTLTEIWEAVLGRAQVGIHDDFFSLGGYSLLATRVLAMVEERTGARLPLAALFEHSTIAELAADVRARVSGAARLRARVASMTPEEVAGELAVQRGPAAEGRAATPAGADDASQREALFELLLAVEGLELARSGIRRRDPSTEPVLSYAQERMWFLDQFGTDASTLGLRVAVAMHGPLDVVALRASCDEIFRRHDVLRTAIVTIGGEPHPVMLPLDSMPLCEFDVDGDMGALANILAQEASRTFDLEREPPIRVTLVRVADEHHALSVAMHHVASDASSLGVFFQELAALYRAFRDGKPSPLPELLVQYDDYASWQRLTASEVYEQQLGYWRQQLAAPLPTFEIPPDHTRPARQRVAGGAVAAQLPSALAARLSAFCNRAGATTFMALLAAFEIVTSRHAGESEVVIGVPIAGRVRPELEPMIGAFLNTLVVRNDLADDPTFRELVNRVRTTSIGAFDNQDVPFELLLADLQPPRDLSRTPLFQIFFNMTHLDPHAAEFTFPGFRLEDLERPDPASKFDLTMYVNEGSGSTELRLVYNRSLFEHAHMQRLVDQYLHVLEQVVADPDLRIDQLSLATEAEAAVLPDAASPLDDRWYGSVPDAVRRVAARAPDRLAVVDTSNRWSFGLLAAQMDRLASWLTQRGVGRGDVVAIYAHRSGSLVWAVTGALASGATYVLLDPRYPATRLAQMLRMASPTVWLALEAAGPPPVGLLDTLDELAVEHRLSLPEIADLDALDALLGSPACAEETDSLIVEVEIGADDPACLTFTSGSSGVPKAVIGRHGSLTHFLPWMSEEFGVGENDRFSMLSGISHDPLQRDMFWPLWLGATIVVPDAESMGTAGWLAQWLRDERVSVAHLTPAMGQLVTEGTAAGSRRSISVPSLRVALFIGDVLTRGEVARLRSLAPDVRVVNLYGTTETQRASGYHRVGTDSAVADGVHPKEILPLGKGMAGSQLLVRTGAGLPAAVGEVGEVVMRSPHLALGYLHDEALTAERFLRDPSGTSAHDQLYVTGDRGRYRADGSVEFLGRNDQQVQLRGFRIELGEVAAVLRQNPAVADAVVRLCTDEPALPMLVAYVVASPGHRIDSAELIRSLRTALPPHMVPSDIVELDEVPLTPNGKIDHRALPAPTRGATFPAGSEGPTDSLEWMLVDIWQKVLGRKHVSIHDDFFALGGYSLLATRLFAIVEDRTGQRLPVSVLFEHPTIAELAAAIRCDGWRTGWSSLVAIQPAGAGQPFFYVAPYMISVLELAPLGDELGRDRPLYGLQPQGLDGSLPPHTTIEEMAAHYITELKTVQPEGPYAIGGHCAGSWVAFEMARQLEAGGDEVDALVLVDQGPPGVERPQIRPLPYIANRVRFYFSGGRLRHALAWQFKILTGRVLLRRVGSPTARFEEGVKEVHRAAYRVYAGGRVQHDIRLILSADSLSLTDKGWYRRWSELTDGRVTIRDVGGTHANLLVQPFVRQLASEIAVVLDAADPASTTGPDRALDGTR